MKLCLVNVVFMLIITGSAHHPGTAVTEGPVTPGMETFTTERLTRGMEKFTTERFKTPLMESTAEGIGLSPLMESTAEVSLPDDKCSGIYLVSYHRMLPNSTYSTGFFGRSGQGSPQTCQERCTEDEKCRSVTYIRYTTGVYGCVRYNISVQELRDLGRQGDITTELKETWATVITYDRFCGCNKKTNIAGATLCLPLGHADKATCHTIPGCCFTEVEVLEAPISMCFKPSGV